MEADELSSTLTQMNVAQLTVQLKMNAADEATAAAAGRRSKAPAVDTGT